MLIYQSSQITIISAEFESFLMGEEGGEFCTHKGCGYKAGDTQCPKCSHKTKPSTYAGKWYTYFVCKCGAYTLSPTMVEYSNGKKVVKTIPCTSGCGKKMEEKFGTICNKCHKFIAGFRRTGKKTKCKIRLRFRALSKEEVCDPENSIKFAAIRAHYVGNLSPFWSTPPSVSVGTFILDLRTGKFLEGRWQLNTLFVSSKPVISKIFKAQPFDTSKMVCPENLVAAIWEKV